MNDSPKRTRTEMFLVRHGETWYNKERIVQGRGVNVSLNELGRRQAEALADRATSLEIDIVYSSTLLRARETAQMIADRCGQLPLIFLSDLEEMSWGVFEGKSSTPEVKKAFQEMLGQWQAGHFDYAVDEGESILDVKARGMQAIEYILREHAGQRIMIVSHGRFLRVVLATMLEEYGLQRMEELNHQNTGLNHLIYENESFEAIMLNDTTHLENMAVVS